MSARFRNQNVGFLPSRKAKHLRKNLFKHRSMQRMRAFSCAAAADEMNDLQAIAFFESRAAPAIARNDGAVQFNRNAIGFHPQSFNQRGKGKRSRGSLFRERAFFSVDAQPHGSKSGYELRS